MSKLAVIFFSIFLFGTVFISTNYVLAAPTPSSQQEALDQLKTAGNTAGINTNNASSKDVRILAATFIRYALSFVGIIFLGMSVYAGFLWMTAMGEEDKISTAKKLLTNGVIGLAIILSAYAITTYIITSLVSATTSKTSADSLGSQSNLNITK